MEGVSKGSARHRCPTLCLSGRGGAACPRRTRAMHVHVGRTKREREGKGRKKEKGATVSGVRGRRASFIMSTQATPSRHDSKEGGREGGTALSRRARSSLSAVCVPECLPIDRRAGRGGKERRREEGGRAHEKSRGDARLDSQDEALSLSLPLMWSVAFGPPAVAVAVAHGRSLGKRSISGPLPISPALLPAISRLPPPSLSFSLPLALHQVHRGRHQVRSKMPGACARSLARG